VVSSQDSLIAEDVFAPIIGHQHVVELLRRELAAPSQAYMFVGPGSIGKGTIARRFGAALLGSGDADVVRRAIIGVHPDLVLVEPEGRASITVDQARSTVAQASLTPMEGARKIFLFAEAGMLNDEAANALLKTLEEPTRSTIFILVTESEDDLPDTIASRCRTVVFGRVADEEVVAGLERVGIEGEQALQTARIAGGRPGLALALATQPEVAQYRRAWLSVPLRLPQHPGDAFLLADEIMTAAGPLLKALQSRQEAEVAGADGEGGAGRALKDRHERELKRTTSALYVTGLEMLAGFYRDAAAAQFGGAVRNADIPSGALTKVLPAAALRNAHRVLSTVESLEAHQRPQLAFASLFADLGLAD
jgi:DNA polymerase-3 subunit delta'